MAKPIAGNDGSFYTAQGMAICRNAYNALYAATIKRQVGRYMALAYCIKRGVPLSVYRLACQLVASEKVVDKPEALQ